MLKGERTWWKINFYEGINCLSKAGGTEESWAVCLFAASTQLKVFSISAATWLHWRFIHYSRVVDVTASMLFFSFVSAADLEFEHLEGALLFMSPWINLWSWLLRVIRFCFKLKMLKNSESYQEYLIFSQKHLITLNVTQHHPESFLVRWLGLFYSQEKHLLFLVFFFPCFQSSIIFQCADLQWKKTAVNLMMCCISGDSGVADRPSS